MAITNKSKINQLYFIAIVIDETPGAEITKLKHYMADHFNSKAALRSPPHITLHMPFKKPEKFEHQILKELSGFGHGIHAFDIELKNFGCFRPGVIFVNVVPNEALQKLHQSILHFSKNELRIFNADFKGQAFHPHVTIAFRDLSKPVFQTAWSEFENKSFQSKFTCQSIALLKHNGKSWDVHASFPLSQ